MRLCTPLLFYREDAGRYRRDVGRDAGEGTKGGSVLPYSLAERPQGDAGEAQRSRQKEALYPSTLLQRGRRETQGKHRGDAGET